jgi:hypothetical protein
MLNSKETVGKLINNDGKHKYNHVCIEDHNYVGILEKVMAVIE